MATALAAMLAVPAFGQSEPPPEPIQLRPSPALQPPLRGAGANHLPVYLQGDTVGGSPDLEATAQGHVEFRRGGTAISADSFRYEAPDDLAIATGNVRITRDGNIFTGPELQLKVQRFEGFFDSPTYHLALTGAGGKASRIEFLDENRSVATAATYSSCPADGSGTPAWLLSSDKLNLNFATNTGVADGAVLRFYDVPVLAIPHMSFPLSDERKSGWLPPSVLFDTKGGFGFSSPYYWNIAPNRDATITPELSPRRGAGVETDFRYLEPRYSGEVKIDYMPYDRLYGGERYAITAHHDSDFGNDLLLHMSALRVSDEDYWKDFPGNVNSLTPRLLASNYSISRPFGDWTTYARIESWQVIQTADPTTRIEAPYEREPQIGARYGARVSGGFDVTLEGEFNRFVNPSDASLNPRPSGNRLDALGSISWPYSTPGWTLTPKLSFNAASYTIDQPLGSVSPGADGSRFIPTASLDSSWVFERDTSFFGKAVRQTLEPRLFFVDTPYYNQNSLPNFDAYPKDFNFDSAFTENSFSGVDRVSDSKQVTAGAITRIFDPDTGAEKMRLGIAQRYLLRNQYVTPDSVPLTRRFSDLLLLGSTTVVPAWTFDSSVDYSPDTDRVQQAVVGVRYAPGPFRTLSAAYRLTRGLSEQIELGWQWPIYGQPTDGAARASGQGGASCHGTWYAVGHLNYSTFDRRLINAIGGFEYDAGCWIARIVVNRQSTGLSEATTHFLFQLELVGLSKIGSNPLQVLKDNIPGYKLLRDDHKPATASSTYD